MHWVAQSYPHTILQNNLFEEIYFCANSGIAVSGLQTSILRG